MLRWMFSAVPWEAASQKQQKNKQNKTKKNQQTLGNTDRRSSTRQSINTQRSKHRGIKEKARLRSTHQATERELIDTQLQHLQHSATEQWDVRRARRRRVPLVMYCTLFQRQLLTSNWIDGAVWNNQAQRANPCTKTLTSLAVTNWNPFSYQFRMSLRFIFPNMNMFDNCICGKKVFTKLEWHRPCPKFWKKIKNSITSWQWQWRGETTWCIMIESLRTVGETDSDDSLLEKLTMILDC